MTHHRARLKGQGSYTLALKKTSEGMGIFQEYGHLMTAWSGGVQHCVEPVGVNYDSSTPQTWLLMRYVVITAPSSRFCLTRI